MRLNFKAFVLACGFVWGLLIFLLTWWIIAFEGITQEATFFGRIYLGYNLSPLGSLIGLAWGFVDGCIGGAVFVGIYNFLVGIIKK